MFTLILEEFLKLAEIWFRFDEWRSFVSNRWIFVIFINLIGIDSGKIMFQHEISIFCERFFFLMIFFFILDRNVLKSFFVTIYLNSIILKEKNPISL